MRHRSALVGESSHERRERNLLNRIHLDGPLLLGLIVVSLLGLAVLYSASGAEPALLQRQLIRLCLAFGVLIVVAQIPPEQYRTWSPWLFLAAVILLLAVMFFGEAGKGARPHDRDEQRHVGVQARTPARARGPGQPHV